MSPFSDIYRDRRVFLTGHTGFKGSWLAAWLREMNANVTGFALPPPTTPNHWDLLRLPVADVRGDIRDVASVHRAIRSCRPEIVFHLAAQPLVRRSYRDPLESWSTNVMGTVNLLEACRTAETLRAIVVVTTDKVYANKEWPWGYRENDRLGGHDPYSASKAASELVVESYRKAFFCEDTSPLVATARAGNVIGGGDWSEDRLIPDIVRAVEGKKPAEIRLPNATRSWQHVLECVGAYLLLGQQLLSGRREFAQAWNFGPGPEDNHTVSDVLNTLHEHWPEISWSHCEAQQVNEAKLLHLDSAKARSLLGWRPVWNLRTALRATAVWYRQHTMTNKPLTHEQIASYIETAIHSGCSWATQ
jgi:CDP-glucose 4,6-dehydratase